MTTTTCLAVLHWQAAACVHNAYVSFSYYNYLHTREHVHTEDTPRSIFGPHYTHEHDRRIVPVTTARQHAG